MDKFALDKNFILQYYKNDPAFLVRILEYKVDFRDIMNVILEQDTIEEQIEIMKICNVSPLFRKLTKSILPRKNFLVKTKNMKDDFVFDTQQHTTWYALARDIHLYEDIGEYSVEQSQNHLHEKLTAMGEYEGNYILGFILGEQSDTRITDQLLIECGVIDPWE